MSGQAPPSDENIICRCFVVTETVIRNAIEHQGCTQVEEVRSLTKACGGCQSCWDDIDAMIRQAQGKPMPEVAASSCSGLSDTQKRSAILKLLDTGLRPLLELNGLMAELIAVQENQALIRFRGENVGTQNSSFLTLKRHLVEAMSTACGCKMNLMEINVLEKHGRNVPLSGNS